MQPICHNRARLYHATICENAVDHFEPVAKYQTPPSLARAGKTVELRDRNRVIAHIVPVKEDDGPKAQDSSGGKPNRKLMRDLGKILRRVDRLPVLDDRSPDEIIGYDKDGLPQ